MLLLVAVLLFAFVLRAPLLTSEALEERDSLMDSQAGPGIGETVDRSVGVGSRALLTPPAWLLPFDDAYIFVRFAQQLSRGRPLQWNDGEPSTGSTSMVFPVLLLPGQWLADGFAGWSWWSSLVGVLTLWLLGWCTARVLRRLGLPTPWPLVGALFVLWSGPVAFVSLGGMETAFACALLLLALEGWIPRAECEENPRVVPIALWLTALLPWIRPDFSVLTGLGAVAIALGWGPAVTGERRASRLIAPALLLPGVALAGLNWWLTGSVQPAGLVAKSSISSPYLGWQGALAQIWVQVDSLLVPVYLGARALVLPPPVGLLAIGAAIGVLWGVASSVVRHGARSPRDLPMPLAAPLPLVVAWGALLFTAPLSGYLIWQYLRHHHPALTLAWILATWALWRVSGWLLRSFRRPIGDLADLRVGRLLLLLLPTLLWLRVPEWQRLHFRDVVGLYQGDGVIAESLRDRPLPPGSTLLVHDAGLPALAHDGSMVDLLGLGTFEMARPARNGLGAIVETLGRRRPLPDWAMVTPRNFNLPALVGEPVLPPRVAPSGAPEDAVLLAPLHTERLLGTALRGEGVDLADLESEKATPLRWSPPPWPDPASFAFVLADANGAPPTAHGCRPLRGGVELDLPPGARRLTVRAVAQPGRPGRVRVHVETASGDTTLGELVLPPMPKHWTRATIDLPSGGAEEISDRRTLRLENVGEGAACLESIELGRE